MTGPAPRVLGVALQAAWDPETGPPGRRGLLTGEPRVRTLLRVLLSYPEVRHVTPDRVSLEAGADPRICEALTRFLERQGWLVRQVSQGPPASSGGRPGPAPDSGRTSPK